MSKLILQFNKRDKQLAINECIGVFVISFFAQAAVVTLNKNDDHPSVLQNAFVQALVVGTMQFVLMNETGAHLNPLASFGTWLTGITPFKRMISFIIAQFIGASIAQVCIFMILNTNYIELSALTTVGQTDVDTLNITNTKIQIQHFMIEFVFSFFYIFITHSGAGNPNQSKLFKPYYASLLQCSVIFISVYSGSFLQDGFRVSFNPARSLSVRILAHNYDSNTLIYLMAPLFAGIIHAIGYKLTPFVSQSEFYKVDNIYA